MYAAEEVAHLQVQVDATDIIRLVVQVSGLALYLAFP